MANELASGYVNLEIKYDDAIKKIDKDIGGLDASSKKAAAHVAANISSGFRSAASEAAKHSATAGSAFSEGLTKGINRGISQATGQMGSFGKGAESALAGITSKAGLTALGIAGVGVAAVAVGKQLYDLGAVWDQISDDITIATGKTGNELKKLTDTVSSIGRTTAADLGEISKAVTGLDQGLTNLPTSVMKDLGSNLAFLDAHGKAVDIHELTLAFKAFNIAPKDMVKALDDLNRASSQTGIPLNTLISTVRTGAPYFKEFKLNLAQATTVMAEFQQAGIEPGQVVASLRIGLKNLGSDARGAGPALADAVTQIKALSDAGNLSGAQDLAKQNFGRNFAPFLNAIKEGTIDAESFTKAIDLVGPSLRELQDATDDGAQGIEKLTNTLKSKFGPQANWTFNVVNGVVKMAVGNFSDLVSAEDRATEALKKMSDLAKSEITPTSPLGRLLLPQGDLSGAGAGLPLPQGAGGSLSNNPALIPSWGTNPVSPPSTSKGSAAKSAELPKLPINTTLPPGFENLPADSSLFSAESSFFDARHNLEEKQAALTTIQTDATATQADLQQAANDVFEADRSRYEAEMKLYEARQSMYDDDTKKMEKYRNDVDNFSGGSLLDFMLFMAFKPAREFIAAKNAENSAAAQSSTTTPTFPVAPPMSSAPAPGSAPGGGGSSSGLNWDALAQAEASGNWANKSNPKYMGGLQFDQATWDAYKPAGAPSNPADATKEQQIAAGEAAIADRGGPQSLWPQNYGKLGAPNASAAPPWSGGGAPAPAPAAPQPQPAPVTTPAVDPEMKKRFPWMFQSGGGIPGSGSGDTVPILGEPGEHMFTKPDVRAMGGQKAVYDFRRALHMQGGGDVPGYGLPGDTNTGGYGSGGAVFPPWLIQLGAQFGVTPSTYPGHQTTERPDIGAAPNPAHQNRGVDWVGKPADMRRFAEYLAGGAGAEQVIYGDEKGNIGYPANVDYSADYPGHSGANAHVHTRFSHPVFGPNAQGAIPGLPGMPGSPPGGAPGANPLQAIAADGSTAPAPGQSVPEATRTEGYIPAGAGGSGTAGSSLAAGIYGMGAGVAKTAVNMGIDMAVAAGSMGTMGAGAMGMGAAGNILKDVSGKVIDYGAQLAGIWTDAAAEILLPFGVPRFLQTDPNQFMPQIGALPTAQTTGEKAQLGDDKLSPGGPVQPGQLPGQQPVGKSAQPAQPGGVPSAAADLLGPALKGVTPQPGGPPIKPGLPGPPGTAASGQGTGPPPGPPPAAQQSPTNDLLKMMGIFDEGGWLGPVGINKTGAPEPVLSHTQNANLQAIANKPVGELDPNAVGGGPTYDYRVVLQNVTVKDVNDLQRQLGDRQKLQMMRHGGRPSMGGK